MLYKGFNSWLRQFTSRNTLFYVIWFYGVRKRKGDSVRLPSKSDNLYLDGYPRSGNTFFTGLIRKVYPSKDFANHLHVISGLKMALKLELPVFVIIREPKDAVISNLYRKIMDKNASLNQDLIESLLISYYNYYAFVKKNLNDIYVMNFESCIKDELLVINKIAKKAGFKIIPDEYLQEMLNSYRTLMEKKEAEKDSFASSLPSEQRENFKKENISKVLNSPYYETAEKIYTELIAYDILSRNS